MQEEVNNKTIALCVQGARITASGLKVAIRKFLQEIDKKNQVKQAEKVGQAKEKGAAKEKQRQEKKIFQVMTKNFNYILNYQMKIIKNKVKNLNHHFLILQ